MKTRRSRHENVWRNSIYSFVAFAVYDADSTKRQFDPNTAPELQSYYNSRYSDQGFKFTDTRYPLEFAVVMRKLATEAKNLPDVQWVLDGETDQSPAKPFKKVYDVVLAEADNDYEMFELLQGKDVFGSSIAWSRLIECTNTVSYMEVQDNGSMKETPTNYTSYKFSCVNVDLRNVLIDEGCKKTNLSDADDCIVFEYLSDDKAKEIYPKVNFEEMGIKPCAISNVFQDYDSLYGGDQKEVYEVMHYYRLKGDKYRVMINGKIIKKSAIPMKPRKNKKKLPISLLVDHKVPGTPYGIGEPSVVKAFREIKNKLRNLIFDITKKVAKPTIAVDPLSSFSEETYTWGDDFIRVAPGDMQPIPVQANLDPALQLDAMTDNDIIISTGINIMDTAVSADETATKTVIRKESQVAITELGLNFNAVTGLKRMHEINADIILLYLKTPDFDNGGSYKRKITTQGTQLFRSKLESSPNKFHEEKKEGAYVFEFEGDDFEYSLTPAMKIGQLAVSEELEKGLMREALEFLATYAPEVIDHQVMGKVMSEKYNLPDSLIIGTTELPLNEDPDVIAAKGGAILPESAQMSNQFKNDQLAQAMAAEQAGTVPMGAGTTPVSGQPVGVVPTGPDGSQQA